MSFYWASLQDMLGTLPYEEQAELWALMAAGSAGEHPAPDPDEDGAVT